MVSWHNLLLEQLPVPSWSSWSPGRCFGTAVALETGWPLPPLSRSRRRRRRPDNTGRRAAAERSKLEQIVSVFHAASKQKAWDHFSKAQRKNLDVWRKQAEFSSSNTVRVLLCTSFSLFRFQTFSHTPLFISSIPFTLHLHPSPFVFSEVHLSPQQKIDLSWEVSRGLEKKFSQCAAPLSPEGRPSTAPPQGSIGWHSNACCFQPYGRQPGDKKLVTAVNLQEQREIRNIHNEELMGIRREEEMEMSDDDMEDVSESKDSEDSGTTVQSNRRAARPSKVKAIWKVLFHHHGDQTSDQACAGAPSEMCTSCICKGRSKQTAHCVDGWPFTTFRDMYPGPTPTPPVVTQCSSPTVFYCLILPSHLYPTRIAGDVHIQNHGQTARNPFLEQAAQPFKTDAPQLSVDLQRPSVTGSAAQAEALKEENDSLRCQLDAYRNEVELLKQEQGKAQPQRSEEDTTRQQQLSFLQQALQGMQKQLLKIREELKQREAELDKSTDEKQQLESQVQSLQERVRNFPPAHPSPVSVKHTSALESAEEDDRGTEENATPASQLTLTPLLPGHTGHCRTLLSRKINSHGHNWARKASLSGMKQSVWTGTLETRGLLPSMSLRGPLLACQEPAEMVTPTVLSCTQEKESPPEIVPPSPIKSEREALLVDHSAAQVRAPCSGNSSRSAGICLRSAPPLEQGSETGQLSYTRTVQAPEQRGSGKVRTDKSQSTGLTEEKKNSNRHIGIISTFLHVHPFGASIEYICSYLQCLDSKVQLPNISSVIIRVVCLLSHIFREVPLNADISRFWCVEFIAWCIPFPAVPGNTTQPYACVDVGLALHQAPQSETHFREGKTKSISTSEVEALLGRLPCTFMQELTGVGASLEKRWKFCGRSTEPAGQGRTKSRTGNRGLTVMLFISLLPHCRVDSLIHGLSVLPITEQPGLDKYTGRISGTTSPEPFPVTRHFSISRQKDGASQDTPSAQQKRGFWDGFGIVTLQRERERER
ncbi:hypothetical protein JZ751_022568 [Albula glossodonta]|uniref:Ecto-NOX disulfide-thiol exchanger 1/2 domain-containing protein n=1 Tax=Albula glossodonta TaxID=121402 RepID=A0A8T2PJI9_9TELE|nr:hypothetical protein JZ751_022568 [Albula glossodonta]